MEKILIEVDDARDIILKRISEGDYSNCEVVQLVELSPADTIINWKTTRELQSRIVVADSDSINK